MYNVCGFIFFIGIPNTFLFITHTRIIPNCILLKLLLIFDIIQAGYLGVYIFVIFSLNNLYLVNNTKIRKFKNKKT